MLGTLVHATIPVQQNSLTAPEEISPKTKLSEWDARECTAVGPCMSCPSKPGCPNLPNAATHCIEGIRPSDETRRCSKKNKMTVNAHTLNATENRGRSRNVVEQHCNCNHANRKWSGMTKNKNVKHTNESP